MLKLLLRYQNVYYFIYILAKVSEKTHFDSAYQIYA